ncbi:thioredoxin domain-containing protein [Desulfurispira natronophila]|uniref:Thioredoxin-like fold domain-containing protein n=1 Tax=Desulfurispira natronophila TaxID=682562 RepID=A0A7W7Y3Q8_9BACT|nr:thioredoxin domain-containing protein [Desulfurispira natronophila]MBB5021502.1 hypothetical protein [Desulfurispira natronophila]
MRRTATVFASCALAGTLLLSPAAAELCDEDKLPQSDLALDFSRNILPYLPEGSCVEVNREDVVFGDFSYINLTIRWMDHERERSQSLAEVTDGRYILSQAMDLHDRTDVVAQAKEQFAPDLDIPLSDDDYAAGNRSAENVIVAFGDYDCGYCFQAYEYLYELAGDNVALYTKDFAIFDNSAIQAKVVLAAKQAGVSDIHQVKKNMYGMTLARLSSSEARKQVFEAIPADKRDQVRRYLERNERELERYVGESTHFARAQGWSGTPVVVVNGRVVPGGFNRAAIAEMLP